jgi:peptide subunit release factor 1 (eRF1)
MRVELTRLEEHIRTLATVAETECPLISCYLDLSEGVTVGREELGLRLELLRKCLPAQAKVEFDQAAGKIQKFLNEGLPPRTKSLAAFSRAGDQPFWLALEFEVPLPTWIACDSAPNIYHLVELKDNYDRYMILLTTEATARIIGVNLGSVTEQLWRSRPELRHRVGREWSKDHYQNHRRERTKQFIHDQVRTLDRLLSERGYEHLILAGNARTRAAVRKALPKRIADKLVDLVPAGQTDDVSEIVASTLQVFLEHEEMESQAIAEQLITQIRAHGLAVVGAHASIEAIRAGQADVLVIVKGFDPGHAWECTACGHAEIRTPLPESACPKCRSGRLREFDVKGELVRLAEQRGIAVEVVEHSGALMSLGGVGCLLRYSGSANYLYWAA